VVTSAYDWMSLDFNQFKPGTTFEQLWELYDFDRRLRAIVLEASNRVEISVRSHWAYALGHKFGAQKILVSFLRHLTTVRNTCAHLSEWTIQKSASLCGSGAAMITEKKLNSALAKIAQWESAHPHGKAMSGLSIPASYYFGTKPSRRSKAVRQKTHPRAAAN